MTPFHSQAAKDEAKPEEAEKEKFCDMKQHKKIIDKGKPDDVMPGRKNANVSGSGAERAFVSGSRAVVAPPGSEARFPPGDDLFTVVLD